MAYDGHGPVANRAADDTWFAPPPTLVPARDTGQHSPRHAPTAARSRYSELDCVRDLLSDELLTAAERRASEIGVGADRVLLTAGVIDEDAYLRWLAHSLDIGEEPLDKRPREACPLDDNQMLDAASAGLLPLRSGGQLTWVIAPRGTAARTLTALISRYPHLASRLRLTSTARLNAYIACQGREAWGRRAAKLLHLSRPALSASAKRSRPTFPLLLVAILALGAFAAMPNETILAINALLAIGFLGWLGMRLVGSWGERPPPPAARIRDNHLPVYTVIAALYREAGSVEGLVASLMALDYPPEKLDIKIVLEPDDLETRAAVARLKLPLPFQVIVAPDFGPRTKPKALNAALPFARGTFTVVYDAEDRPESNQLRSALAMFAAEDATVACGQARLTIDNTADGWLASLFTAEYAAQFDLFLPGMTAKRLLMPLGGSSNHFRTAVLREIGAWDPYNVTEDADLGVRLVRFGYRCGVIHSTTYEEAPARLGIWIRQRTRWFKGWVQTWDVHMRAPRRLLAEVGTANFVTFQLIVGGNVLAALVHPIFLIAFVHAAASGRPIMAADGIASTAVTWMQATVLVAGYLTSILLGLRGLAQRQLLATAWSLIFVPFHWLLLSFAAWRAVIQFMRNPYRWEKTEHGLARTSRLAQISRLAPERTSDALVSDDIPPRRIAA
jgi:cellulose synthase/poly-beta-1,6-N-acetylglucosamine synthase-like glycosyltransferase